MPDPGVSLRLRRVASPARCGGHPLHLRMARGMTRFVRVRCRLPEERRRRIVAEKTLPHFRALASGVGPRIRCANVWVQRVRNRCVRGAEGAVVVG